MNRAQWVRADDTHPIRTWHRIGAGMAKGSLAGLVGVALMTAGEKAEQRITGRPDSFMPGHTLERLLGRTPRPDAERRRLNLIMHTGQAALLGAWRGVMAEGGLRGWRASALFTVVRLANDQTLETVTGQGAPPWTWPRRELVVDVLHKAVYAFGTGLVADALAADPPAWQAARERGEPSPAHPTAAPPPAPGAA
jgi:hypothetical protein